MPEILAVAHATWSKLFLLVAIALAILGLMLGLFVIVASRHRGLSLRQMVRTAFSALWLLPVAAAGAFVIVQALPYFREGGAEIPQSYLGEEGAFPEAEADGPEVPRAFGDDASAEEISLGNSVSSFGLTEATANVGLRPSWANESNGSKRTSPADFVSSRQFLTIAMAEADAVRQATVRVKQAFEREHGRKGDWAVSPSTVRSEAVREASLEKIVRDLGPLAENVEMYRVHLLLDLSPPSLDRFYPAWRTQIVERRLWALGGLFGMLSLLLATATAYLRLDTATGGAYRRRLKLAAVSVITAGGLAVGALLPAVS